MDLIIDGYNLLHCAGITVDSKGPYTLEKSRQALLNFLAATFDAKQLSRTTVVFDAKNAPPGLPQTYKRSGIKVLFADRGREADEMIALLVERHSAPKQLLIVSSDHAVQRSAKRRKAKVSDSEVWFARALRDRSAPLGSDEDEKPLAPLSPDEVAGWIDTFDVAEVDLAELNSGSAERSDKEGTKDKGEETDEERELEGYNPFPDGYGEDLLP